MPPSPLAVVRYGRLRRLAEFSSASGELPAARRRCVVRTPRGVELGRVIARVDRGEPAPGELLREATPEDLVREANNRRHAEDDLLWARKHTAGLAGVAAVASERLLEGQRAVIYYTSRVRVDVPTLLSELEDGLGIPVSLHQLGARQRASVCGSCGVCGRTLCCSSFLRPLRPVTMRMAKVQGLDLSPRATAGACGRLKCCLRYENPVYLDLDRDTPRVGWTARTPRLEGTILAVDLLRGRALVRPAQGRARTVFLAEIEHSGPPPRTPLPAAGEDPLEASQEGVEPGWSQLAKRLWRRVNPRPDDEPE